MIMTASGRPSFLDCSELSLLLFGGKGGVGKTTCAVATAIDLARRYPDRQFLLVSIDPAHSLRDSVADSPVPANLQVQEIDFRVSLEKFKKTHERHFREIALRGTFLDEQDLQRILDLTTPGFDELMAFTEIATLLQNHSYSCVIVDTAPTGHTLRFLDLPQLMHDWVSVFDAMLAKHRYLTELYRPGAERDETDLFLEEFDASIQFLAKVLSDPASCRFVPVMLGETMSTNETERLIGRLKELKIPVTDILVNRLFPVQTSCQVCSSAGRRQQRELRRLTSHFSGYALWGIPLLGGEVQGCEQLGHLWDYVKPISAPNEVQPETGYLRPLVAQPANLPVANARLVLFAGKGGVGKTTMACATAVSLSRRYPDKKVLLFSTDPAHSLSDCFDIHIGPTEVALAPGLTAMELDATAELEKLKHRYTKEVELFFGDLAENSGMDLAFDHDVIERMLDLSPPAQFIREIQDNPAISQNSGVSCRSFTESDCAATAACRSPTRGTVCRQHPHRNGLRRNERSLGGLQECRCACPGTVPESGHPSQPMRTLYASRNHRNASTEKISGSLSNASGNTCLPMH